MAVPGCAFDRGQRGVGSSRRSSPGWVNETVDGGERHGLIWEYLAPFAERLVGGDQQGVALVAAADQLEQHAGFGLILADVGDVVEDEQVILVELGDRAFEA